jgi:hypothetical protein
MLTTMASGGRHTCSANDDDPAAAVAPDEDEEGEDLYNDNYLE